MPPLVVGSTASVLEGKLIDVLAFEGECVLRHESDAVKSNEAVASFFARRIRGDASIRVRFATRDGSLVRTRRIKITDEWRRYEISLHYEDCDEIVGETFITIEAVGLGHPHIAFDIFNITEGSFATSPIVGRGTVGRDIVSFASASIEPPIFPRGSLVMTYVVNRWISPNLRQGDIQTLLCFAGKKEALLVGFFGNQGGALCALRIDRPTSRIERECKTDCLVINGSANTLVAAWSESAFYIFHSGIPLIGERMLLDFVVENVYIGSCPDDIDGFFRKTTVSMEVEYVYAYPDVIGAGFAREVGKTHADGAAPTLIPPDSPITQFVNSHPYVSQYTSELLYCIALNRDFINPRKDTEDMIRNFVSATLKARGADVEREQHKGIGRTDLVFSLPLMEKSPPHSPKIRVEFKIRGRHGYDELPEQPLKYMDVGEKFAVLVVYDLDKRDHYAELKEIIIRNSVYVCSDFYVANELEGITRPISPTPGKVFYSCHYFPGTDQIYFLMTIYIRLLQ